MQANWLRYISTIVIFTIASGCIPNSPYSLEEIEGNNLFSNFTEAPKTLDPASSYSENEYKFLAQIYEPPFQYHFLKRPYQLIPLTSENVPEPIYYDKASRQLPPDCPSEIVAKAVYRIRIKEGIQYQEHPCFAVGSNGQLLYHQLTDADVSEIWDISQFQKTGHRQLEAKDYVLQIKRFADPRIHCPILSVMAKYIGGLQDYAQALAADLKKERDRRRKKGGVTYSQEADERTNPLQIDYDKHPLPGIRLVDTFTYEIILTSKYPQFKYWLAMPFFSPMPHEAVAFYNQGPLRNHNITLQQYPVGTGAFRMQTYNPNYRIVLARNENFRIETYPAEGDPDDEISGLLQDAGKPLPFLDKVIFPLEKEAIPSWNKFLQGYYDTSGIGREAFDKSVSLTSDGNAQLTDYLTDRGINLKRATLTSTFYYAFNMLDDVVGGYSQQQKKLRQALAIAFDIGEYIQIFNNGRGIEAQSPLPPGIFGYEDGEIGLNPVVFHWDSVKNIHVRRSISDAKTLLVEAGYPDGRNADGEQLVLTFDSTWTWAGASTRFEWIKKQFNKLGIVIQHKPTDYNRFQDKARQGNWQIISWGWNADYPDPENFFFLLYGPNGKVKNLGENACNYASPEFDALFKQMETMENGRERLDVIRKMRQVLNDDIPWFGIFHPVSFSLTHSWYKNAKINLMGNNNLKYKRIDAATRIEYQQKWNQPILWPVFAMIALFFCPVVAFWIHKYSCENRVSTKCVVSSE